MNSSLVCRVFLSTLIGLITFGSSYAQTTTHSLGATTPFGWRKYKVSDGSYENTDAYYLAMFTYGFRRNLTESDNTSFSLGPQIGVGAGLYSDLYGYGLLYSGDLQLWGDYNMGMGAIPEPAKNTGWYFGLGAGISYTGADGESIDGNNGLSYGPMGRVGFRFGVYSRKKDEYKPMSIGLYYKHGVEQAKWRTIGFHIMADL